VANKNAFLNYEQKLFISGIEIPGVTNIDGGYQIEEEPINILGKGFKYSMRQGPLVGNFNVSKYYIGEETLLNYTGDNPINGSINYGDQSFGFEEGYLTEYSLSFGIGQIPTANASFVVYGDIGDGINDQSDEPHPDIQIPNQGSIEINISDFSSNRVSDFSYTMRMNRSPIYAIGSPFAVKVHQIFPIIQECKFNLEVFDYEITTIKKYLESPIAQDVAITIKNPISESTIQTFSLNDARLLGQEINSNADDVLTIGLTYNAYINER